MLKIEEIVESRELIKLISTNFRLHPKVHKAFKKMVKKKGCTQIYLLEKYILEGLERDG